jgi:hypothetical protein
MMNRTAIIARVEMETAWGRKKSEQAVDVVLEAMARVILDAQWLLREQVNEETAAREWEESELSDSPCDGQCKRKRSSEGIRRQADSR